MDEQAPVSRVEVGPNGVPESDFLLIGYPANDESTHTKSNTTIFEEDLESPASAHDQDVQLRKIIHGIDDVLNAKISSRQKARCLRVANHRMVEELLLSTEEEDGVVRTEGARGATEAAGSPTATTRPDTALKSNAPQLRFEDFDCYPPSGPLLAGRGHCRVPETSKRAAVSDWLEGLPDRN